MAILALRRELAFLSSYAILICIVFAYPKSDTTDIQALLELKLKITSDPLQVMKSWNESTPLCQWYGVTCGSRHKRVEALYLDSSRFTGAISPYVGNLSFLRELYLQNNSFTGNIPPEIGRLRRLRFLRLGNNSLTGKIPSNISYCYNLEGVEFSGNNLEGEIPIGLGFLPKLVLLLMHTNSLHGQIPSSLGNLSTLEKLELGVNNLTGVLPSTLGQLNRLTWFEVGGNRLSGSIPPSLYNLSLLSMFHVGDNLFHGSLPTNLFDILPKLQYFYIHNNHMSGKMPISLSNASSLFKYEVCYNKFTGKIPSLEKVRKLTKFLINDNPLGSGGIDELDFLYSLTNNNSLEVLDITNNNFGGLLSSSIGNLSSIRALSIGDNNLFGPIPTEIGNLINLEVIEMNENQLLGEIPSSIGNLKSLTLLFLDGNKLSGKIPSSLGNLTQLIYLLLGNNRLQGIIPHTLGKCKSLNFLNLSANELVGSIPLEIFQISSLLGMSMSRNRLVGPLPIQVESLENINFLDVAENMLSQTIPSSLGKCINLRQLYMQGNLFEGMIPPSLGSLRGIDVIELSRNNLSGQIPRSFANLMLLQILNLSYNNLEGPLPTDGIFKNTSKFFIIGNKNLCGGIPELTLPKCNIGSPHKKASHIVIKLVLGLSIGLLGMSLICVWLCCRFGKKRNIISQDSSNDPFLRLTYQSLLKATNGFSSTNKLGSGSFGLVYKANLDTSETIVAVKVFDLQRHGASRSFMAECEALKRIRHRNLVKILTACSGIDFSGNEFKALIYEFMANGSLEDRLHSFPTREDTGQPQKHLRLIQRLDIAIDVACALDYLHHACEIPIVHRDIKPSNVLLNDEMIGHVGDFGISKILVDASNSGIANPASSTGFNGTIGYVAPEYGMGSSVSTQGDVYSFGVLLLEMFTGKKPSDAIFKESMNIVGFVKAALPDKVAEIMDSTFHSELEEYSNARNSILEYLIAIFEIGVSCSVTSPIERKSMKDVVAELRSVRKEILGNQTHGTR